MPREMIVVPHRSEWKTAFERERSAIESALIGWSLDIHHIGSTAVEGLAAKPIIDILIVVGDLGEIDRHADRMESLGYEPKGEFGIGGRRFFRKGGDENPTHHVHVFARGDRNILRYIALRDYLRAFPHVRDEYGALKQKASDAHRFDREGYMSYKDSYVKETETRAVEWYERRYVEAEDESRSSCA